MTEIICFCRNVTKSEITSAIQNGAKTLKDIQQMTSACTGNSCEELNPSGKCCSTIILTMLHDVKPHKSSCGCCK